VRRTLEVRVAHTADVSPPTLKAARALLDQVFGEDMSDDDWEHALGGMHALAWAEGHLVGHASLIQRRLLHRGRALRTGYVEGVAVHPERRRQGYGTALMAALEHVIRGGYELGALGASPEAARFYTALGWLRWQGSTWALSPRGTVRTADEDDCVYVFPVTAELDLSGELTCDWRDGALW
jgi:aminoglycoside 2'-N-acetyltransferase I